jgi:hypothetical protein
MFFFAYPLETANLRPHISKWVEEAWEKVSSESIQRCFIKLFEKCYDATFQQEALAMREIIYPPRAVPEVLVPDIVPDEYVAYFHFGTFVFVVTLFLFIYLFILFIYLIYLFINFPFIINLFYLFYLFYLLYISLFLYLFLVCYFSSRNVCLTHSADDVVVPDEEEEEEEEGYAVCKETSYCKCVTCLRLLNARKLAGMLLTAIAFFSHSLEDTNEFGKRALDATPGMFIRFHCDL